MATTVNAALGGAYAVSRCFARTGDRYYSLPGTHFAIDTRPEANVVASRTAQSKYTTSVIKSLSKGGEEGASLNEEPKSTGKLESMPFCFIADTDSITVALDTGANRVIVNEKRLLTNFRLSREKVKGLQGKPIISGGQGRLRMRLESSDGHVEEIDHQAIFCPTSPYNLAPPQLLVRALKKRGYRAQGYHDDTEYVLRYSRPNSVPHKMRTPISPNDLFLAQINPGYTSFFREAVKFGPTWRSFAGAACVNEAAVVLDDDDQSLTHPPLEKATTTNHRSEGSEATAIEYDEKVDFAPLRNSPTRFDVSEGGPLPATEGDPRLQQLQKKQMRLATLHEKLGHVSFEVLNRLAQAGLVPRDLAGVPPPKCPGCQYGKAHRKPWRSKGWRSNNRKLKPANRPGEVVSIDQLVSPTPGFVPTHRGHPTTIRYIGATVFCDHYSDFTYVHLMTKMDAEATVKAKEAFERIASEHGTTVKHYHADNGLFDTKAFKQSVRVSAQTLSFCGVNAHHQNGVAERRIRDVTEGARTALLHAAHRWPKAIHASLWPCAVKHYVNLRNSLPRKFTPKQKIDSKLVPAKFDDSPVSRFSGTIVEPNLKHFHPFGSPVYVLQEALQSLKAHNKWTDRARVGIFLCHSPHHATDVPLVLNSQTGLVSPQFHLIYDDNFDTVKRDAKFQSLWQVKAKIQTYEQSRRAQDLLPTFSDRQTQKYPPSQADPNVSDMFQVPWLDADTRQQPLPAPTVVERGADNIPAATDIPEPNARHSQDGSAQQPDAPTVPSPNEEFEVEDTNTPATRTRSGRVVRQNPRFFDSKVYAFNAFLRTFETTTTPVPELLQPSQCSADRNRPMALAAQHIFGNVASSRDPDTMTLDEALKQPDRAEFIKAMHKEIDDHVRRKHWKVVHKSTVPKGRIPIPMVWSMKRKRNPIGEITKWKARLCAGGHRQQFGIDYWSTYSPVVSWSTVRLMIVTALLLNWHMESIDFVLAFPQAPVATETYMRPPKVPPGFNISDLPNPSDCFTKVYKLLQNLYGLKDAGRTWYLHLKEGLVKRGWKQSNADSCLFMRENVILILYVDDAVLISPDLSRIKACVRSLQADFALTDDGPLHDYLGTRFLRSRDGSIELTQPRMIQRVLEYVGIDPSSDNVKMHDTPAASDKILNRDTDGPRRNQTWNYRGVLGCLSYLQSMVRPDITFAVQQCARFANDPRRSHEVALKRICRYLLRTKDRGLVYHPNRKRGLECYVDADWAGSWHHDQAHDPLGAFSRTGYVIYYAGCPILWGSKMQPLVALSTTEAEYIALSSALREVIAIMNLITELRSNGFPALHTTPNVICRVFEDNKSCLEIATNHKSRPRTKHLSVRLHHFRSYVKAKLINIEHISTKDQIADIYTKPLPRQQFRVLRDQLMGWPSYPTAREGV